LSSKCSEQNYVQIRLLQQQLKGFVILHPVSGIFYFMIKPKRHIALTSVLAMLLYLGPNMVQDIHRVWGHHEHHHTINSDKNPQLESQYADCPICVFEFNVVDEIDTFVYIPILSTQTIIFVENRADQIQNKAFHYYNLRAPPQA